MHNLAFAMKARRQQLIRRLVSTRHLHSQHELQELLREEGFEATQATLSRDLAELGVLKGADGYRLPGSEVASAPISRLEQTLRRELLSVLSGGTTVVLKTPIGHGSVLAVELDAARIPGLLGSIAGDDTIFLAATGPAAARRIASQLARLAGLDSSAGGSATGSAGSSMTASVTGAPRGGSPASHQAGQNGHSGHSRSHGRSGRGGQDRSS
jgi:transcriptional regulator of arginine metabolism